MNALLGDARQHRRGHVAQKQQYVAFTAGYILGQFDADGRFTAAGTAPYDQHLVFSSGQAGSGSLFVRENKQPFIKLSIYTPPPSGTEGTSVLAPPASAGVRGASSFFGTEGMNQAGDQTSAGGA
ncbi:hypothetical protein BSK56_08895 [Paenibacillus borealis]|uniref:Uncharacterized protein n=1 Tax=Paenibacillus borealis TaxID=160799 RepID=A0ABX3HJ46_PAEBO|nr:hypothetical protein BSK56_08895 [Paenibacillus borealis]